MATNKDNTNRIDEINNEMRFCKSILEQLSFIENYFKEKLKIDNFYVQQSQVSQQKSEILLSLIVKNITLISLNEVKRIQKIYENSLEKENEYLIIALNRSYDSIHSVGTR